MQDFFEKTAKRPLTVRKSCKRYKHRIHANSQQ